MTPEQRARDIIDRMLVRSCWVVQDRKRLDLSAGTGIAIREYPTDSGPADYILFVDREPVGVIEAKSEEKGELLSAVEEQSYRYATGQLKWKKEGKVLPFLYESTGAITHFTDLRDPKPRAREVFAFHKPETLRELLKQSDTFRKRLRHISPLNPDGLRDCQLRAIQNLELSFADNRPKALVQMATGSGKTFTAITSVYRLLKFAGARRILFLVDTRNLGEQAEQEFQAFKPNDDQRKFTELYNVQRLRSSYIDSASHVCISTIQRMYSILRGEEMDESVEETSLNEIKQAERPKDVAYNTDVPIETFDVIVVDECHRSIYNLWKQVLDYFDAFYVGLTATPDVRTYAFFNKNVVSEYTHEQAVADNVNVGYDVYTIDTEVTRKGGVIAKQWIETRDRKTRRQTWEEMDEEVIYEPTQLDRDVVNKDQIRTIIRTFKEKLRTEIFPGREEAPKTLIFAKSDSHADDIIQIVREEFAEGNAFCKKVTYSVKDEKPSEVLQQFRTAFYPRIAVTVDMIATGTDVKPIECLLFMRDVRSRSYFEQMKGRGTRTLSEDDLRKVTPSARSNKTHFVIVDAVGVCKSMKTDSRPLERNPGISLRDLMMHVVMGTTDENTVTSLANRLTRLDKQITPAERDQLAGASGGEKLNSIVKSLLQSYDPDVIHERALAMSLIPIGVEGEAKDLHASTTLSMKEMEEKAKAELVTEATHVFQNPDFRERVENIRKMHNQIIDNVNLDTVLAAEWDKDAQGKAAELVQEFKTFLETNRDTITALQIFYAQPYRRRELTFAMIKELVEVLKMRKPQLAPARLWQAYEQLEKSKGDQPKSELIALVSLVRHAIGIDEKLTAFDETVNRNFQKWAFKKQEGTIKFNAEQMEWLRMIKDYVAASVHIEKNDFDLSPFVDRGGLAKAWQLFGDNIDNLIQELNEALAA
ncbi:DEAD/DEAH box helicase family protein [bacterium]|nr:DEAD/DEAH box helicase family protein [bacterium]